MYIIYIALYRNSCNITDLFKAVRINTRVYFKSLHNFVWPLYTESAIKNLSSSL